MKKQQAKYVSIGLALPLVMGFLANALFPFLQIRVPELATAFYVISCIFFGYAILKYQLFVLTPATAATSILAAMSDFLFLTNLEGNIQQVNQAPLNILGYEENELIGQPLAKFLTEERAESTLFKREKWDESNRTAPILDVETSVKTKGGRTISLSLSAALIRDTMRIPRGIVYLARDITERKRAEVTLRESEERLRSTLTSLDDLVFVLDNHGIFRDYYQPPSAPDLYVAPEGFLGKHFKDVLPPHVVELGEAAINTVVTTNEVQQFEYPLLMKGKKLWFSAKVSRRTDSTGEFAGVTLVARNITARKRMEAATRDLEARRANFIEITSHELRTPLTAIKGYVELLEHRIDELDQESKDHWLRIITRNVQRLERLVTGVSILGQLERGVFRLEKREVDFFEFLTETLQPYHTRLGRQLEVRGSLSEGDPVFIEGDPDRLLQVLDNLMENAIKHTPPDRRKICVISEIQPHRVCVQVSDNGAGIAPEDLSRIFDQFTSIPSPYSTGGTGIGLYLARMLVEAHGGTLTAYSVGKDQGTTFVMKLPRSEGKTQQ